MAEDGRVEGEAGVIEEFMAPLASGFPGALGLKDDCAVLAPPPGEELVLKTDAVAEGVHYLACDHPADVGWKALAVNVSDLAAKGARPLVYLLSLSFPEMPRRDWLAGFSAGLGEAQRAFGMHLAGGDTDKRPGPASMTLTVIGAVPAGRMPKRPYARPGHRLFVSGTLGDSALGLKLALDPGLGREWGLEPADVAFLLSRYRRPSPRLALRAALLDHARASMDLSDGLAKDLGRMCRASGTGAKVDAGRLPLSPAVRRAIAADPRLLECVVAGGDDYEVLTAVAPEDAGAYESAARAAGVTVTEIGEVTSGAAIVFVAVDGNPLQLSSTGWDHFGLERGRL